MSENFRPVIVESPYAGDIELNERYARAAMRDCLLRGEAPFASHLLYTQPGVLRDGVLDERKLGIQAGFAWRRHASATVVYDDLGISDGMQAGIDHAITLGHGLAFRSISDWQRESKVSEPETNTSRELYRENTGHTAGSYYENSVHVTGWGDIAMNVGGTVITLPIHAWHALARQEMAWEVSDRCIG